MPRISIRFKLALVSIVILSVPYVGFQYLRETERYLQSSLEDSLLAISSALALSLQDQSTLFRKDLGDDRIRSLFVHTLSHPIQIDGYIDDWAGYRQWSDRFVSADFTNRGDDSDFEFDLIIGEANDYLYVLIDVVDKDITYQTIGEITAESADTIELVFGNTEALTNRVLLGTSGQGPVTAYSIVENWDFSLDKTPVTNIVGEWRETARGYVVEVRIPLYVAGNGLSVIVHDRDNQSKQSVRLSSSVQNDEVANHLLRTSAQLQQMIERVGLKKGRRVWVINRSGQVLASGGSLAAERKRGAINFLYTWILPAASESFVDDLKSASRLRGEEVLRALNGHSSTRWRSSPDERAVIVSAAHPVRAGNELVGAIVIEETTNSIQTLQRDAMASLFNQSIFVFLGVSLVLLIFASRLTFRISSLRDQAERAIDEHGRVTGGMKASDASDEIGDLSRSFAAMLSRLSEYNNYLEGMASKLTHELRTPLTVVSSSLENLDDLSADENQRTYLERARSGINRLHGLVTRLGEAARLEQAVENVDMTKIDLAKLLHGCVEGYRVAYPDHRFALAPDADSKSMTFMGSGELMVQLLDKLIENACAFADSGTPISVGYATDNGKIKLTVSNFGPPLPEEMQTQIFSSMVSVRSEHRSEQPHLGLGLYIVRLIAEIHGGNVAAYNLPEDRGVTFCVEIPKTLV